MQLEKIIDVDFAVTVNTHFNSMFNDELYSKRLDVHELLVNLQSFKEFSIFIEEYVRELQR